MKKLIGILVVCAMFFSVTGIVDAKQGDGNGKGRTKTHKVKKKDVSESSSTASSSRPHGWSQGKKKGWQGSSYPPGWSKWDKKKKERWTSDRDESEDEINEMLIRYKIQERKRNQILRAYDQAIVGGLAINDARKTMVDAIKDEKTRRGLMIDTAQSVLDLLR